MSPQVIAVILAYVLGLSTWYVNTILNKRKLEKEGKRGLRDHVFAEQLRAYSELYLVFWKIHECQSRTMYLWVHRNHTYRIKECEEHLERIGREIKYFRLLEKQAEGTDTPIDMSKTISEWESNKKLLVAALERLRTQQEIDDKEAENVPEVIRSMHTELLQEMLSLDGKVKEYEYVLPIRLLNYFYDYSENVKQLTIGATIGNNRKTADMVKRPYPQTKTAANELWDKQEGLYRIIVNEIRSLIGVEEFTKEIWDQITRMQKEMEYQYREAESSSFSLKEYLSH